MNRPVRAGTRYFAEYGVGTQSGLPPLYRSRVVGGIHKDELWNVERRDWVETQPTRAVHVRSGRP